MTLREAARAAVAANRARQDVTSITESVIKDIEFQIAMGHLDALCESDPLGPRQEDRRRP